MNIEIENFMDDWGEYEQSLFKNIIETYSGAMTGCENDAEKENVRNQIIDKLYELMTDKIEYLVYIDEKILKSCLLTSIEYYSDLENF
jgi:hypothetical protein